MAESGDTFAQYTLGVMYRNGWDVPQDLVQALKWLSLAMSRSSPGSDRNVASLARTDVAAKLTVAEREEAEKEARDWFDELARRGSAAR
ncbi:MAG: SEL1-like repeat protein [Alphaproteobacteria bacterium]|nr:SEL1-like repeat protein [Alphaproteobacteria bacterium]